MTAENKVTVSIEIELQEEDKEKILYALDCNSESLEATLKPYAKAALIEYINMFVGRSSITRAADIQESRLLLLIKEVFNHPIPDDRKISKLFHITLSQSRTLIKAVLSKNQYILDNMLKSSLQKVIDCKIEKEDKYEITIHSIIIVNELNQILGLIDGNLPKICKKEGTVSTYIIKKSSHKKILEYLNRHQNQNE